MSQSSRIGRMAKLQLGKEGEPPLKYSSDHPDYENALEAMVDLLQIEFILKSLNSENLPTDMVLRLRRLAKDQLLPQYDGNNTKAEEMSKPNFTAMPSSKGQECIRNLPSQSIVIASVSNHQFGIAVKRIKSSAQFETRMREATTQILNTHKRGLIVADVSRMLNPSNQRAFLPIHEPDFIKAIYGPAERFRQEYESKIKQWTRTTYVLGVFLLVHVATLAPPVGWSAGTFRFALATCQNLRRYKQFEEIEDRLNEAEGFELAKNDPLSPTASGTDDFHSEQ